MGVPAGSKRISPRLLSFDASQAHRGAIWGDSRVVPQGYAIPGVARLRTALCGPGDRSGRVVFRGAERRRELDDLALGGERDGHLDLGQ